MVLLGEGHALSIDTWDWRFRVAFDEPLRQRVLEIAADLESRWPRHAEVIRDLVAIHEPLLSVTALFDALEAGDHPDRHDGFLAFLENDAPPLALPASLVPAIEERAWRLGKTAGGPWPSVLGGLVRRAAVAPWRSHHREILEVVFGASGLEELLRAVSRAREGGGARQDEAPLAPEEVPGFVEETLSALRSRLPSHSLPDFRFSLGEGPGFGEYWPLELREGAVVSDELRLSTNADASRPTTLRATLVHEVVGHAWFYERARRTSPPMLDHGALALVEGWATWCEWLLLPRPAGDGPRWLSLLDREDDPENAVAGIVREAGYSPAALPEALLSFTQLPAFQMSYVAGAVWFSQRLSDFRDAESFFGSLADEPWGDFFKLW